MTDATMINCAITSTVAPQRLNRLRKKCFLRSSLTAAAKASTENKPVIAALKRSTPSRQNRARWGPRRCATQNLNSVLVFVMATSLYLLGWSAPARAQNQTPAQARQQLLQDLDSGQLRD